MPSLASLQSRVNSPFISCWRTTQQDLNMSYQNITKHRFKEKLKCFPSSEMYYLYDGRRNTCPHAPSASAQPTFLQLFTSGPLGGFQTHRLRESIGMWGYFIQAHHLRPGLGTGPNLGMRLRGESRFSAFNPGLVFRDNLCHGGTAERRQYDVVRQLQQQSAT